MTAALGAGLLLSPEGLRSAESLLIPRRGRRSPPRILLRSVWQWQNVGDVCHGLGMVALIRSVLPDAAIVLWSGSLSPECRGFLARTLPNIDIIEVGADARREAAALFWSDLLVSSSSPGLAARNAIIRWQVYSKRPYGFFGLSLSSASPADVAMMQRAGFAYFRDTTSLKLARDAGVTAASFVPDDAFACDPPKDRRIADAFHARHGLKRGRYICCVPRYRFTPRRDGKPLPPDQEAMNARSMIPDHEAMRTAIVRALRTRAVDKVLVCHEDISQIGLGKQAVVDLLPPELRSSVVWLDRYWLPDEAMAAISTSAGVLSLDQHTPILAIASGVPALLCRSNELGPKGQMWRDLGLGAWQFDIDEAGAPGRVADAILSVLRDPDAARDTAREARDRARSIQAERMAQVARLVRAS